MQRRPRLIAAFWILAELPLQCHPLTEIPVGSGEWDCGSHQGLRNPAVPVPGPPAAGPAITRSTVRLARALPDLPCRFDAAELR
jgi:hypothetical protein